MTLDRTRPPTWGAVNIPTTVPSLVRRMPPGDALDKLVHEVVFRHNRRVAHSYWCGDCKFVYALAKSTEHYTACRSCGGSKLHYRSGWRRPAAGEGSYSSSSSLAMTVIDQMEFNFARYFGGRVAADLDFGWRTGGKGYYARFAGGSPAISRRSPATAVAKAAVLTPFLWDPDGSWAGGADAVTEPYSFVRLLKLLAPVGDHPPAERQARPVIRLRIPN